MGKTHLTERQAAFVDAYLGEAEANGTKAAKLAGYSGSDRVLAVTASQLLKHHRVKAEIEKKQSNSRSRYKLRDLRAWWARIMEDEGAEVRDRVRASELLGKSLGAFTIKPVRHEHAHVHVRALSDKELEAIASRGQIDGRVIDSRFGDED